MFLVSSEKTATKMASSKGASIKKKFDLMYKELMTSPKDGEMYKRFHGERLDRVEEANKHLFSDPFEIHSCEFANRVRFVYEIIYKPVELEGSKVKYEGIIHITNVDNHMYKRSSYVDLYSEVNN